MTGLVYGGQTELLWARLLHHDMLYIRLTALRVLSGLGEAGARALLMGPSFRRQGESYPFVWALSRCIHPGLFSALQVSGSPAHDLLSRARFLVRRAARRHEWRYQRGRAACAEAIVNSDHPLETLACTLRLLEMHRDDSVPALLEILRLPAPQLLWDEKAECAAWALGQIGTLAVPEILQEYRNASQRVAEHLATALWYLGPAALRALPQLLKDNSHQATAALLAMEEKASLQMVAMGRGPVWLDEMAVQALAEIAFSEGHRSYAAAALSCFGPAALSGLPILKHLARDPRMEVRLNVARGLGWGGRPEGMSLLAELAEDPDHQVAERARESMESYYSSPTEMHASLLVTLRSGEDVAARRRAAEQLARIGIAEEEDISDILVSGPTLVPLLRALGRGGKVPIRYRPLILDFVYEAGPVRQAAAPLLAIWPDDQASRLCWRRLLWEGSHEMQDLAVAAVRRSGLSLREWGLEGGEIRTLPTRVLGELLAALSPDLLHHTDLLPLLRRPEVEARLAAAIALRSCAPPLLQVEEELEAQLRDQNMRVAVECARTLVALGGRRHRWALLRSPRPQDRELALDDGELPERFHEEYVDGSLYSEQNAALLRNLAGLERAAEIEVEAIIHLRSRACSSHLACLGQPALDKMPELLVHFAPAVRLLAREALKGLLSAPVESYSEWLAYHGLVLPLEDGAHPGEMGQLQQIVSDYLVRAQLWSDRRFRLMWRILSRSFIAEVASRAVDSLARSYLQSPDQGLLESLLLALQHPEESVRRAALVRLGSHVDYRGWAPPLRTHPSPEAGLAIVARRFAEGDPDLQPAVLQRALEKLIEWRLNDCQFFVPDSPERLLTLFELSGRSPLCDGAIHRLIWSYRGQTTPALWQRLQALSLDPAQSHFHPPLAERWPKLVIFALRSRQDWLEWVLSLGSCAKTGLRQALNHKEASLRLQGLAILGRLEQGFSDFFRVVTELAKNDPDPAVQAAAHQLLNPEDKQ
ncbi:MAG: HEAT repeat domain-containing protein [Candidatus Eremiobacteraeota bacterium]|nr:HEAT repeat domain-containing protein [Candidatus Eremiobacteraeota bacterium]MCW5870541.1 HEAT repeat domain-containing protein [Candidatus Eremiobacteraeota bacterium]